jgi:hypothetical protein
MDANKLAKAYIKIRDALSDAKREFEEKEKALKAEMATIEHYFLNMFNEQGDLTSMSTPSGTVIRSVSTRIWTTDWAEMHKMILDTNNLDLLERRLAQKNMESFLADNPGVRPAGLNVDHSYKITVRRK